MLNDVRSTEIPGDSEKESSGESQGHGEGGGGLGCSVWEGQERGRQAAVGKGLFAGDERLLANGEAGHGVWIR